MAELNLGNKLLWVFLNADAQTLDVTIRHEPSKKIALIKGTKKTP